MPAVISNVRKYAHIYGSVGLKLLSPPFPSRGDLERLVEMVMPTGNKVVTYVAPCDKPFEAQRERTTGINLNWLIPFREHVRVEGGILYPSPLLRGLLMDYYYTVLEELPSLNKTIEKLKRRVNFLEEKLEEERRIANNALEIALSVRNLGSLVTSLRSGSEQILSVAGDIQVLLLKVDELKTVMQRSMDTLLSELKAIKEEVAEARRRLEKGDLNGVREALDRVEERVEQASEGLPTWVSENPWLELIMKSRKNL